MIAGKTKRVRLLTRLGHFCIFLAVSTQQAGMILKKIAFVLIVCPGADPGIFNGGGTEPPHAYAKSGTALQKLGSVAPLCQK